VIAGNPRWYEGFFGVDSLLVARTVEDTERTRLRVDLVVERLGLEPASRVLDLACGHGRRAVELARRGFAVTGLDPSEPSPPALARERAGEAGVDLELVAGDMRELPRREEFDAVLNLWTAFGHLVEEADGARTLAALAAALRPGGSLLLHTLNLVLPRAASRVAAGTSSATAPSCSRSAPSTSSPAARPGVDLRRTFVGRDGSRPEQGRSLRAYAPEAARAAGSGGFRGRRAWGGWHGRPFDFEGARAHRPRARAGIKENGAMRRNGRPWSPSACSRAPADALRRCAT
jgi:SAM-dependent methyltransferase